MMLILGVIGMFRVLEFVCDCGCKHRVRIDGEFVGRSEFL